MARPDGPQVRRLRLRNGWTQAEMAQRIGRTQAAISKVESGRPVSHVLMRQVARALKVKFSEIALPIETQQQQMRQLVLSKLTQARQLRVTP